MRRAGTCRSRIDACDAREGAMVHSRHSQLGSSLEVPAEWQHSPPSSLLFVGPLQVPEFQQLKTEATPLQLAPFASIRSQGLDIQPFVEELQQGLANQAEELARRVEGTKRRFRNLARSKREGLQNGRNRQRQKHMQTEHESCSQHDHVGTSKQKWWHCIIVENATGCPLACTMPP